MGDSINKGTSGKIPLYTLSYGIFYETIIGTANVAFFICCQHSSVWNKTKNKCTMWVNCLNFNDKSAKIVNFSVKMCDMENRCYIMRCSPPFE